MAYRPPKTKPEPNQADIIDGDYKYAPSGEAVFEALRLKLPKPSVDGENGQLLARGLNADSLSWVNPPGSLPSGALEHQVLVYDGAAATWAYPGLGDGTLGTGNVILGRDKPTGLVATNNTIVGINAASNLIGNSANGTKNVIIGTDAAPSLTGSGSDGTGSNMVLIGYGVNGDGIETYGANGGTAIGSEATLGTGTGGGGVAIGYRANYGSSGAANVAIGKLAASGSTNKGGSVVIGGFAGAGGTNLTNSVAIGAGCFTTRGNASSSDSSVLIGSNVMSGYDFSAGPVATDSIVIGSGGFQAIDNTQTNSVTLNKCIILGKATHFDTGTYSNLFVAGSLDSPIDSVYFSQGRRGQSTLRAFTLNTTPARGENASAVNGTLTIAGSQGTGTGVGGDVIISTAPASLSSGFSPNAHVERVRVTTDGKVGIGTASPSMKLEVDAGSSNDILKLVSNAYSYSLSRDNSNGNLKFTGSQTGFVGYTFSSPEGDRLTIAGSGNVTIAENLTVNKQSTLTGITGIGTSPISNVALVVNGATDGNQLQILQNAGFGYKIGRESSEGYLVLDGTQTSFCGYIFKEDGAEVFKINRNKNVQVVAGDLSIDTVGKGLAIKSGTNAKIGTAQFTSQQTVTVNTTAITTNSLVFVTGQDGVNSYAVQNKVASTGPGTGSFEIHHVGGNTTSLVAWMIVEATP